MEWNDKKEQHATIKSYAETEHGIYEVGLCFEGRYEGGPCWANYLDYAETETKLGHHLTIVDAKQACLNHHLAQN